MNTQNALKVALREILGPAVRDAGFKGSGKTWRRTNELGDWSIVNVQSSPWSTSEELRCVINISVAPEPWITQVADLFGKETPKLPDESWGLYRDRIHPTGSPQNRDTWWIIRDAEDAEDAANDMVTRLKSDALPLLVDLLDRPKLLETVRKKNLGQIHGENWNLFFMQAEAILLADKGTSPELTNILNCIVEHTEERLRANSERLTAWVQSRALAANR